MISLNFYFYPFKMHGGISYNPSKISFKEASNPLNNFIEKPLYPLNDFNERTMNMPKVNIKNIKSNVNNDNYTDADSLVEYFHGMILNYISLEKENNIVLDNETIQLEKVIKNYNKDKTINNLIGGEYEDFNIDDENTPFINIDKYDKDCNKITVTYNNYTENNEELHYILIELMKNKKELETININLNNANIYMLKNKLTTNAFSSSNNTSNFIELSIKKLINLSFRKDVNALFKYKNQGNLVIDGNNKNKIYGSILSLLIMLLSFRNNMDKGIYSKYYFERYLKQLCDNIINDKSYKFHNNRDVHLTYLINTNEDLKLAFSGDCMINTLMCVKKEELQELLVKKIEMIKENEDNNGNEVKDYENENQYLKQIEAILQPEPIVDETDYINIYSNIIYNYSNKYFNFIKKINKYKPNENYDYIKSSNENYMNEIKQLCDECVKYDSAILSSLADYGKTEEIKQYINVDDNIKILKEMKKYLKSDKLDDDTTNYYLSELKRILTFYKQIIDRYNVNNFYINMLITLYLIVYKIDYLFDEEILKYYSTETKRKYGVKRFINFIYNANEVDLMRFNNYHYNNYDYLFTYIDNGKKHALIMIIKVNPNNLLEKRYYVCNLNDLNFVIFNYNNQNITNTNNLGTIRYSYTYYSLSKNLYNNIYKLRTLINPNEDSKTIHTYIYNNFSEKYMNTGLLEYYLYCANKSGIDTTKLNEILNFPNIEELEKNNQFTFRLSEYSVNNAIMKVYIYECFNTIYNYRVYNDDYRLEILKTNDKNIYENYKKFFININTHIKEIILKNTHFYNYVIINNKDCIIDNFVYYFIDFIYNNYSINNITELEFYDKIIKDYFDINTDELFKYLSIKDKKILEEIEYIIYKFAYYKIQKNMFSGGEQTNNINYNNIIKRILIILLVIIIIIIIVLIILFIINKYKNNISPK